MSESHGFFCGTEHGAESYEFFEGAELGAGSYGFFCGFEQFVDILNEHFFVKKNFWSKQKNPSFQFQLLVYFHNQ